LVIEGIQANSSVYISADNGSGNGVTQYIRANGLTGEVNLSHYGTEKFATKSDGIAVSGIVTAISGVVTYYGDGSNLTSLDASQLSTGTVPGNRGVTAGSSSSSFVEYNGTTRTNGQFDGGTTDPNGSLRLNYSGYLYATRFYGNGGFLTNVGNNVINILSIDSNGDLIYEAYEANENETINLEDGVVGAASSVYSMFMSPREITPAITYIQWSTNVLYGPGDGQWHYGGNQYSSTTGSGKLTVTL
jgi:hypothetical protein